MISHDVNLVCNLVQSKVGGQPRTIVAIAGPPASGKSTLAELVVQQLNRGCPSSPPYAALLTMDGYHLDNRVLESRGLLARKGAPETFDGEGFCQSLHQLVHQVHESFHPIFERQLDLAIANAVVIHKETHVVVVEGNYLLLQTDPWRTLSKVFAATVFVNPSIEALRDRLHQRWLSHGLDTEAALARAVQNDLPNAEMVIEQSSVADLKLNQNYAEQGGRYAYKNIGRTSCSYENYED